MWICLLSFLMLCMHLMGPTEQLEVFIRDCKVCFHLKFIHFELLPSKKVASTIHNHEIAAISSMASLGSRPNLLLSSPVFLLTSFVCLKECSNSKTTTYRYKWGQLQLETGGQLLSLSHTKFKHLKNSSQYPNSCNKIGVWEKKSHYTQVTINNLPLQNNYCALSS